MSRPHTHEALKSVRCAALKLGMRSFLRLECFALTENALGFFRVWIGLRPVAAVRSVERLRMSADAHFIADHVTLATSVPRVGVGGNQVFSLHSLRAAASGQKQSDNYWYTRVSSTASASC
jgi:hypothetical protein